MKLVLIGTVASSIFGFRKELIEMLLRRGHTLFVFALDFDESTLDKARQMGVIPIEYKMSRGGINFFADIRGMLEIYRKIQPLDADVVFSYFSKPLVYGTMAGKLSKVPRLIGMLEGLGQTFTRRLSGISFRMMIARCAQLCLYRWCFRYLDCLILLNKDDLYELTGRRQISVKRAEVLGGIGVDLDFYAFSEIPCEPMSFIFVGRLIVEKGIKDFISAAIIVRKRFPKTVFTVLGALDEASSNGFKRSDLDEHVNSGLVNYVGHVNDVASWLRRSSVFVLPSFYREGVPRSSQEALAIGRPIITTDLPGCRETVIDGLNGFLIPPWRPDRIAEKMCFLLDNVSVMRKMGLASRALAVEKFDAKVINRNLIEILESK